MQPIQGRQKFYFIFPSWQVKSTLLQVVVVASAQACTLIKCFHYLYEPPQQSGTARQAAAAVSTFGLTERPDFLLRVFWNWRFRRRQQALTERPSHKPFACGLAFEGACLFLTFLVNLPWEHWIPSSWSLFGVQTVLGEKGGRWWGSRGGEEEADAAHANSVFWCTHSLTRRVDTR